MASKKTPTIDPRVDDYIASRPDFARPILERVRAAFHAGCPDLVEGIKWGVPTFERNGIVGGMAAFKAHVSFGFWRAPEMDDPAELFGEVRKQSFMQIKIRDAKELPTKRVMVDYVKRAARLGGEVDGPVPKKSAKKASKKPAPRAPKDLLDAIKESAPAAAFWKTLPAGYRREYVEWITEAKRDATREKRLMQTVEWLGESKRRNWKYESC